MNRGNCTNPRENFRLRMNKWRELERIEKARETGDCCGEQCGVIGCPSCDRAALEYDVEHLRGLLAPNAAD